MASFRDPAITFSPTEVIDRLLEIKDYYGYDPVLYISSSSDLATYLDSFGFDIYSMTANTDAAFNAAARSVQVMPSGTRSHDSITAH